MFSFCVLVCFLWSCDLISSVVYRYFTLSPDQESGKAKTLFACPICTDRAKLDKSSYLERNLSKPHSLHDHVYCVFYTKDKLIEKMNTRCSVRGCGNHYYWHLQSGRKTPTLYGCDVNGLCLQCKREKKKGAVLQRKDFPVIPYQGRTTAGRTASFEYQEDYDNYLEITS